MKENKLKINITENIQMYIDYMKYENINNKYTFFYDETNNIRKLFLKENSKVNIQLKELNQNFLLGGVCYEDRTTLTSIDFEKLKSDLYLDKKIIEDNLEIKFKHIAKGDFLNCLKSKKLKTFLEWILSNNLYIHYSTLDIFYWSIVDIIESSVEYYPHFQYKDLNYFKAIFYEVAKANVEDFLKVLTKYNYPNIKTKKNKKFINEIIIYIANHKKYIIEDEKITNNIEIETLIDILRHAKGNELVFIEKNIPLNLIDKFGDFYHHRLAIFKNSKHIFDIEEEVIKHFNQFEFYDGDVPLKNYIFKDSKDEFLIQVSDITAGLLGKYMTFINELKFLEINKIKNNLNSLQIENMTLLFELLIQSELKSKAFVHHIAPLTAIEKGRLLAQEFIN
jgi:hypothetical protein